MDEAEHPYWVKVGAVWCCLIRGAAFKALVLCFMCLEQEEGEVGDKNVSECSCDLIW